MGEKIVAEMNEATAELASLDPKKKKKRNKVVILDPVEEAEKLAEKTENLSVCETFDTSFSGAKKKKKKKPVEHNKVNDELVDAGEDVDGDETGADEEGEGTVLGSVQYPWEGTDRDFKYEEAGSYFFSS